MAPEGPDVEKQEPKSPKSSSSMTDPELRYVTSYLVIQFSECRWTPLTHYSPVKHCILMVMLQELNPTSHCTHIFTSSTMSPDRNASGTVWVGRTDQGCQAGSKVERISLLPRVSRVHFISPRLFIESYNKDLNILFVCLPLAWVWHFKSHQEGHAKAFSDQATFARKLICYPLLDSRFKPKPSMFLVYHSTRKTLRLGWGANGPLPR